MGKAQTIYKCGECGSDSVKWQGQCPACGAWNSFTEVKQAARKSAPVRGGYAGEVQGQKLADVQDAAAARVGTGIGEFDRVLGGGLVGGSVVLIGGDPGIGKSTLLLQAAGARSLNDDVLYITGEESLQQIALRARRLEVNPDGLSVLAETCVEQIVGVAEKSTAQCLIVDSIQTIYSENLPSAPGSVAQLRECAAQLVRLAKTRGITVILVGHVTKDGNIAGPRVLEHMVDVVLYFESESGSRYRILRSVKNRFGAANELGVFAMADNGMREVKNPSAIFLSEHTEAIPGCVVTSAFEGTRPLLIEVQALADQSGLGQSRRLAVGMDQNRLSMMLATLSRHGGIAAYDQDIFINVVGGVKIAETSADLAAMLAIVSSIRNMPVPRTTLVFGEVGLAGEIRPVAFGEERLQEAAKRGFTEAIVPRGNMPKKAIKGMRIQGIDYLRGALDAAGLG